MGRKSDHVIEFEGNKYYFHKNSWRHYSSQESLLLHKEVWRKNHGVIPEKSRVRIIDPSRPHDDINNLILVQSFSRKGSTPDLLKKGTVRNTTITGLLRDITQWRRKICLCCHKEWSILHEEIQIKYEGHHEPCGSCEPHCIADSKFSPESPVS